MEIYTLNQYFQRETLVEEFLSAIWTERYTKSGDVVIITEDTPAWASLLAEGTFLGLVGSDEVMLIDTVLSEDGTLKMTGNTLDAFLAQRIFRASAWTRPETQYYTLSGMSGPGQAMLVIVELVAMGTMTADNGLDKARQVMTNLSSGPYDTSGPAQDFLIPTGTLYDNVQKLADTYQIGFSLYLDSVTPPTGYSLKFKTYKGLDRTSGQTQNSVVKFSPVMDSLTGISRLLSISGYKTIAYAFAPDEAQQTDDGSGNIVTTYTTIPPAVEYIPGGDVAIDFDRRELMIEVSDATVENLGSVDAVTAMLHQQAKDALANNNYTKVVDGEVVPQSEFQYGIHYSLGDIVELDAGDGFSQAARITEYIRSQDKGGDRAYPTVSVID